MSIDLEWICIMVAETLCGVKYNLFQECKLINAYTSNNLERKSLLVFDYLSKCHITKCHDALNFTYI